MECGKSLQIGGLFIHRQRLGASFEGAPDAAMLAPSRTATSSRDGVEHPTGADCRQPVGRFPGRLRETLSETTYDTWFAHAEPQLPG